MKEVIKITKGKKCEYCDDYADLKIKVDGLNNYLCNYCFKNRDKVKAELNKF